MALLLRMAGIPARVSTGFRPARSTRKTGEYVVRDFDAHSWVEAWFPGYGWVTFDPTPAAAPARASPPTRRHPGGSATRPDLAGGGGLDPRTGLAVAAEDARRGGATPAARRLAALPLAARGVLAVRRWRRGAPAPLPELERALRRTRRRAGPGRDPAGARGSFARSPDAAGYVRALRDQRYRGRGEPPTARPAPRAAVRAGTRRRAARTPARVVGAAAEASAPGSVKSVPMADVYDLFQRGTELLEAGDFAAAAVPLAKARDLDPEKASIREALGRAYFRSGQFEAARAEFEALVERQPTNDYGLFCLGRALLELGRPKDARKASRWPPDCVRTAATTASTGTAHGPPHRRSGAITTGEAFVCPTRGVVRKAGAGPLSSCKGREGGERK